MNVQKDSRQSVLQITMNGFFPRMWIVRLAGVIMCIILFGSFNKASAIGKDNSSEEVLIVPVGYWKKFKQINKAEKENLTTSLHHARALIPKDVPLTLRNVTAHINRRLVDEKLGWRLVVEIKLIEADANATATDPFSGISPASVREYLDMPISTFHGQKLPLTEIRKAVAGMSVRDLIYFAAASHNLTICWLDNKTVVLVNYTSSD